jgi:hypothetical protein
MIHLSEPKLSIFDFDISLDQLLTLKSNESHYLHEAKFEYSYNQHIKMNAKIGNAQISAHDLIYYPQLNYYLRQLPALEYHINMNLSGLEGIKNRGINQTINALKRLNTLLEEDKQKKAILDAQVNNLIMLHGQKKDIPIYQGYKPYYSLKNSSYYSRHETKTYQIQMSGLRYYFNLRSNRFKAMKKLYELNETALFKPYLENQARGEGLLNYGHHVRFIGGIINTPILAFHIKQSYKHQGKRHYLDTHTHQVFTRLSEIHELATYYAKNNYKIDIVKDIKK